MDEFFELIGLLVKTPSISYGDSAMLISDDGEWGISFSIDVDHPVGWKVVRKFADTLNDPSNNGGVAMFYPSPTDEFCPDGRMRWCIQGRMSRMAPKECACLLYSRLPHPVDEIDLWRNQRHSPPTG